MSKYEERLISLVKANPDAVPEKLSEMIASARGHAGGVARRDKAAEANAEVVDPVSFGEFFKTRRLFVEQGEVKADGDLTDWLQIMPGPGTWKHPKWGKMVITPETLDDYVANFDNRVYQEHIPIDAEHKTKLSGALAYYREMKVGGPNNEPGVWSRLELTERGKDLIAKGAFKYFSPEMYDDWEDPATERAYKNVITGGAFTTRPFFKESSLQPIAASELTLLHGDGLGQEPAGDDKSEDLAECIIDMVDDGLTDAQITAGVNAAIAYARAMKTAYDGTPSMAMNEAIPADSAVSTNPPTEESKVTEESKNENETPVQMAEQAAKLKTLSEQLESERNQNKQLAERVAQMEERDQVRRFTEVVTGKGGANDGGHHFFGEMEQHVSMLTKLAKTFGEESEEVTAYITQQKAVAEALATSGAMSQVGHADPTKQTGATTEEGIMSEIKAFAEVNKMDISKATDAYLRDNPARYAEYDREFKAKARG